MTTELTGRTRFRSQKRFLRSSLIVFQVEERIEWGYSYDPIDGGNMPGGSRTEWRDARLEDLSILCFTTPGVKP